MNSSPATFYSITPTSSSTVNVIFSRFFFVLFLVFLVLKEPQASPASSSHRPAGRWKLCGQLAGGGLVLEMCGFSTQAAILNRLSGGHRIREGGGRLLANLHSFWIRLQINAAASLLQRSFIHVLHTRCSCWAHWLFLYRFLMLCQFLHVCFLESCAWQFVIDAHSTVFFFLWL